jgi:cell division protein FtsL
LQLLNNKSFAARRIAKVLVLGFIGVVLLGLLLNVMIAQSAYEMANLKNRTKELTTTSQVLQQQVFSLASNQNLEQVAHDMGMVANTNPVFLDLKSQQIFGRPMRAGAGNQLENNLVANSALTDKTNVQSIESAKAKAASRAATQLEASAKTSSTFVSNVAAAKPTLKKVSLPSGGIPGSPTH